MTGAGDVASPPDTRDQAAFTQWCRTFAASQAASAEIAVARDQALTLAVTVPDRGELFLSLSDPWLACERAPADCDRVTRTYLLGALRTIEAPVAQPTAAQIRPAIRSADYVQAVVRARSPDAIAEEFLPGLWVVYMVDLPEAAKVLRQSELAGLRLTLEQVRDLALANLEREIGAPTSVVKKLPKRGIGYVTVESYYNTSLVLLHGGWKSVSEGVGGQLLVSLPTPELLLYADGREPDARDALRAFAARAAAESSNVVFPGVLRWTADGWQVLDMP